ncbi:uncharacterized protein FOMMEDRAFT_112116 [Fomitiporia mediterranea MF3/22]|uniref:uncharacterized protein n=1 Tax=Fomitiporia mediterranea (strain MF3/22) TaxID=694068 RepID=UPI0004409C52|nr:uncharacterized protein FOMMEDRAFT_112116 [Fomitiporia mediterranea MF3/22]EJD00570.1 hypothetical protein FOMMEDRAFT_112116 [Fomitiporia mediterranea MF3/22]
MLTQHSKTRARRRRRPALPTPLNTLSSFVVTLFTVALAALPGVRAQAAQHNLTDAQIATVVQRLADGAKESWELGTRQQALIELNTPTFSVLNDTSVPPPSSAPDSLSTVLNIIAAVIENKTTTASASNLSSPQSFFPGDGSAADPASNGVAALVANWTGKNNGSINYGQAAVDQTNYLWSSAVPKTEDGAISHRVSQVQLWSDFVYMVPPFLAYYGVMTQNRSMVSEAYNQISLYRKYLRDSHNGSLWRHVVMGSDFQDEGFWSTGNGWAAAGMLRVLGTIQNSQYRNALKSETKDLRNWVNEIHDGMYAHIRDDGMFHNYVNDNSTFVDASSAVLLASTVYRHALLTNTHKHLPDAEFVRKQLWSFNSSSPPSPSPSSSNDSSSLANMTHFTSDGWLTPVVNPHSFGQEGKDSPEGQAFVVMMYAAWRDWVENGAVGANAAIHCRGMPQGVLALVGMGVVVGALTSRW